jgi:uncharacterized cupin superfamily protein
MHKFNVFNAPVTYDDTDPAGYAAGSNRFGPTIAATRLAATVYELPPGESVCPYHYESAEEWLLVLEGQLTLRHPEGEEVLSPGDIVAFPTGPSGAHKTTNNGTTKVRIVMLSTNDPIEYCVYPDSNKIAFSTDSSDPADHARVRRGENLDYYDGET